MNIAFMLQSFGVKVTPEDIANAENTLKELPSLVQLWKHKLEQMEARNIQMHAMISAMFDVKLDAVDAEHARQIVLFPPTQSNSAINAAFEMQERTNYDGYNGNSGNAATGTAG